MENLNIYPANLFVTDKATLAKAIHDIEHDLVVQVDFLNSIGKHFEAKRLDERVKYDVEMIRELGYCSGIENYSRYLDGRAAGVRPFLPAGLLPAGFPACR